MVDHEWLPIKWDVGKYQEEKRKEIKVAQLRDL
jgi:hypothetical protein